MAVAPVSPFLRSNFGSLNHIFFLRPSLTPCPHPFLATGPVIGSNYKSSMDLHIGVTDSQGNVYEFESQGVRITSSESSSDSWNQCLVIPIASQRTAAQTAWTQHWDYTLSITAYMDIWSSDSYQETDLNCYSFVLTFLKMLHVKELKPSLINKTQFCSDFILQRTRLAAKYISLYRQVIREAVSVIPLKSQQSYNTAAADASV